VLLPSGDLVARVVCLACAKRAVAIVPVKRSQLCSSCTIPSDTREASVCGRCLNEQVHKAVTMSLQPFATHLHGLAKAYRLNSDPKAEGLQMAAELLESARPEGVR
jgi:hypothetical protein